MRPVRLTWTRGGAALVAAGVLGMLGAAAPGWGALRLVMDVVFGVAVLLFAVGLSREASVVRRGPLGVVALAVLALWPLVVALVDGLLPPPTASDPVRTSLVYADLLVTLAAAIVAVVQIGRAGTVPRPWRWAPLWALVVSATSAIVPQVLFVVIIGPTPSQDVLGLVNLVAQLGFLARTLGLGILALVLAARLRPDAVEVLRSA